MTERWLPITGYEGTYEVSDLGRVRSLDRISSQGRRLKGQVLKQGRNAAGYMSVGLHLAGDATTYLVHRLVLTAFEGPPPDEMETRHMDGNSSNNVASNLVWGTSQENIRDQLRHGTQVNAKKTKCPQGHLYDGENLYVEPNGTRRCRTCKADTLARWRAENPARYMEIQRQANRKYDARRRAEKAA